MTTKKTSAKKKPAKTPAPSPFSHPFAERVLSGINESNRLRHKREKGIENLPDDAVQEGLPPDPEGMNEDRASWALHAIKAFQDATGTDECDAIGDLLADLRHLCDRMGHRFGDDFDAISDKSRRCYEDETYDPDAEKPAPVERSQLYRDGFADRANGRSMSPRHDFSSDENHAEYLKGWNDPAAQPVVVPVIVKAELTKAVCETCGSDDVTHDGVARWNVDDQDWELSSTFDNADCGSCGGECNIEHQPLDFDPFDHPYVAHRVEVAEQPDGTAKVRLFRPGKTRKTQRLCDDAINMEAGREVARVLLDGAGAYQAIIETMEKGA